MTTDDRSGYLPPHEFRIPLGQVVDPAGAASGNVGALSSPPAPSALSGSSPGLSTGAAVPPIAPSLPDPTDPQSMTLLFARLANEMFGGSSAVPMSLNPAPLPQHAQTLTSATTPSPGISPTLVPGPTTPGADPTSPASTMLVQDPAAPVSGVGGSPPGIGGGWPTPTDPTPSRSGVGGSPPGSPGGVRPPEDPPQLTATGGRSAPSMTAEERMAKDSEVPSTPPAFGMPLMDGAPPAIGMPSTPTVPTSPGGIPTMPGNPFGMPLDLSSLGHVQPMSMSVLPEPVHGDVPYYLTGSDMLGLESEPSKVEAYESKPRSDDPFARDLGRNAFDPYTVRKDFPILEERVHGGKRLVWLDNAATTQKPRYVIDRISYFYEHENSNVHRAAHTLAARSTDAFEKAREAARRFLNGGSAKEIVWVRGATEGINLIAKAWGGRHVGKGDEIVITHLEHHANIVPWQMLCAEKGARLRVAPVDDRGDVILDEYEKLMGPKTRLVSIPHVSNALGTITPAKQMVEIAHRYGARVMVDGAQAVSHMKVDVQDLGCDWYVFSGHKVFAPTGIGVVWGREDALADMPPWQGGGNMIEDVTFEKTRYQPPPFRFEAGTGSIGDAVGLGAAIEYVERIGMDVIDRYEHELLVYGTQRLATVPGLTMIGTSPNKAGVLSFVLDGQRTEDVSAALDKEGIAVRSGHHCAQPILRRYGLEATVRASLAFYNVCEDIDALVAALHRMQGVR